jgi:TolB-like protein/predicted Zn-dependent protease
MMLAPSNRSICLDGTRCAQARTRRGLSRERLAEQSRGGLSIATIKRLEKGAAVYLDTARRLAALLEVPLDALLGESEPTSELRPHTHIASGPATIAVLPFEIMGAAADSLYFGDGLVEDLITRLGRHWFPVISRGSSFRYRERRPEPQTLRAELGADYVIEGSIRRSESRLRVTARLTETRTALQVWANTYDRPYADVFALEEELTTTIVGQVASVIVDRECRELMRRDPSDLTAWELALRGSWHFHRSTRDANVEARSLFEQALTRDPMQPMAWFALAMTHQRSIVNQWSADARRSLHEMKETCAEFRRRHPDDPRLSIATAYADVFSGERQSAMARLREGIELDPNAAVAYSLYGQTLAMEHRPDEAIEQFEQAMRLSPRDSDLWSVQLGIALCHFVAERYADMLEWAELALRTNPAMPFPHSAVAVAHAYLGDDERARAAVQSTLDLEPRTTASRVQAFAASTDPEIIARYVEGLRRAGFPG